MLIKELKVILDGLPESFDDFNMVNGEYGKFMGSEELSYRLDKPILTLYVDEETKELCFLHQTDKEISESN